MQRAGAEMLVKSLKEEGVEIMFGYPGGVLLDFYDALFNSGIKHILPRQEQAGATPGPPEKWGSVWPHRGQAPPTW